jgi:hypothetical protein
MKLVHDFTSFDKAMEGTQKNKKLSQVLKHCKQAILVLDKNHSN